MAAPPIFLFTDFGTADIYVGQVKAVLHELAPASAVIDLLHDAPVFSIEPAAHLLAALAPRLPRGAVTMAVVDPGVGSDRGAVIVEADERYYVAPDNGLLSTLAARAHTPRAYALPAAPPSAAVSFHGRDLFAPVTAKIAASALEFAKLLRQPALEVELGGADLAQVIYIDHYGNVMTGLRAEACDSACDVEVRGKRIPHARVFSAVPRGSLFWYVNSIGLVEIAANQANAAAISSAAVGDSVCPT